MESKSLLSRIDWRMAGLLAILAIASILIRIPFFEVPMINDEGGYAYVAWFWTDDFALYRDIPFDRPQAIFLLYKVILATFGTDVVAIRLFTASYNAVNVIALFLLTRRVFSESAAWAAASIFAIISVSPAVEGFTGNAELFMVLPIVLSAHLAWNQKWAWAGGLAALAVLFKPSGVSALVLALLWTVIVRTSWSAAVRVLAGFVLGILPSVLHGYWIGFGAFWRSVYQYRLAMYGEGVSDFSSQWSRFQQGIGESMPCWVAPAVLTVQALTQRWDRRLLFGALWVGTCLMGIAMGGWWRSHYFVQLLPPLSFLSGAAIIQLRRNSLRWLWIVAILVGTLEFVTHELPYWFYSPREISSVRFNRQGYLVTDAVTEYISTHTNPDDRIYVAVSQAEWYYLSRRRGALPQYYYDHLRYSREVYDQVMTGIKERKPELIILQRYPPEELISNEDFDRLLREGYVLEKKVQAIPIFRRKADTAGEPEQNRTTPSSTALPSDPPTDADSPPE